MPKSRRPDDLWTERMRLRPITRDDVDVLFSLDSDPEVMRYITGGLPSSQEQVAETIAEQLGSRWIAHQGSDDGVVGWFGLVHSAGDDYELGYRLFRRAWGTGLAVEGALALIDMAFRDLGAHRVWAETMTVNARSRRVMDRCGLRYVRTFHREWEDPIDGAQLGEVEYELTRAEWELRVAG